MKTTGQMLYATGQNIVCDPGNVQYESLCKHKQRACLFELYKESNDILKILRFYKNGLYLV